MPSYFSSLQNVPAQKRNFIDPMPRLHRCADRPGIARPSLALNQTRCSAPIHPRIINAPGDFAVQLIRSAGLQKVPGRPQGQETGTITSGTDTTVTKRWSRLFSAGELPNVKLVRVGRCRLVKCVARDGNSCSLDGSDESYDGTLSMVASTDN